MNLASRPQAARRFLFDAHSTTLRGHLTRPDPTKFDSTRTLSVPLAGGEDSGEETDINFGKVLSIGRSTSKVEGRHDAQNDSYETVVTATVENLSMLEGRLTAKRIVARLTESFSNKDGERTFSIEGSGIEDLVIDGEKVELNLDDQPFRKTNWKKLAGRLDGDSGLRRRFEDHDPGIGGRKNRELGLCSLAAPGAFKKSKASVSPGACITIPDFGRIWLAELLMTPDTWRLTMLRAKLGSPAEGEFELADTGANGQRYPP